MVWVCTFAGVGFLLLPLSTNPGFPIIGVLTSYDHCVIIASGKVQTWPTGQLGIWKWPIPPQTVTWRILPVAPIVIIFTKCSPRSTNSLEKCWVSPSVVMCLRLVVAIRSKLCPVVLLPITHKLNVLVYISALRRYVNATVKDLTISPTINKVQIRFITTSRRCWINWVHHLRRCVLRSMRMLFGCRQGSGILHGHNKALLSSSLWVLNVASHNSGPKTFGVFGLLLSALCIH